jgi:hypothetical protein
VLAATGTVAASQALKKHSTLVEKNIDALSNLLQLNQAERALLLYGTLARYQRDLRSMLVEFKVSNAPEAYAVIADLAGVKRRPRWARRCAPARRLERIGLVENLISEHNITDLADLMKVSEKLPPVLMREYRDQSRADGRVHPPRGSKQRAGARATSASCRRGCAGAGAACCKRPSADAGGGRERAAVRPARHRQDRAGQGGGAARPGWSLFEVEYADRDGNSLSGRDRYRSMQIAQVFLKGTQRGGAAVRRGGRRVSAGQRGRGRPDGARTSSRRFASRGEPLASTARPG